MQLVQCHSFVIIGRNYLLYEARDECTSTETDRHEMNNLISCSLMTTCTYRKEKLTELV